VAVVVVVVVVILCTFSDTGSLKIESYCLFIDFPLLFFELFEVIFSSRLSLVGVLMFFFGVGVFVDVLRLVSRLPISFVGVYLGSLANPFLCNDSMLVELSVCDSFADDLDLTISL